MDGSFSKMLRFKIFCFVLFLFVVYVQSKSLEHPKVAELKTNSNEMMEAAESQNPFLPRFAMKALRERNERAKAQRRNYITQRRTHQPKRIPCHQYYVSSIPIGNKSKNIICKVI